LWPDWPATSACNRHSVEFDGQMAGMTEIK
jgi:hypothetical protein